MSTEHLKPKQKGQFHPSKLVRALRAMIQDKRATIAQQQWAMRYLVALDPTIKFVEGVERPKIDVDRGLEDLMESLSGPV